MCIRGRKGNRGRRKLGLSPLFGTYNGLGYIRRRVSVCVAILLVPHLTFEYFMQTIRRCSYFMPASRKRSPVFVARTAERFHTTVRCTSIVGHNHCIVSLSKQTYLPNKFPQFSTRKIRTRSNFFFRSTNFFFFFFT